MTTKQRYLRKRTGRKKNYRKNSKRRTKINSKRRTRRGGAPGVISAGPLDGAQGERESRHRSDRLVERAQAIDATAAAHQRLALAKVGDPSISSSVFRDPVGLGADTLEEVARLTADRRRTLRQEEQRRVGLDHRSSWLTHLPIPLRVAAAHARATSSSGLAGAGLWRERNVGPHPWTNEMIDDTAGLRAEARARQAYEREENLEEFAHLEPSVTTPRHVAARAHERVLRTMDRPPPPAYHRSITNQAMDALNTYDAAVLDPLAGAMAAVNDHLTATHLGVHPRPRKHAPPGGLRPFGSFPPESTAASTARHQLLRRRQDRDVWRGEAGFPNRLPARRSSPHDFNVRAAAEGSKPKRARFAQGPLDEHARVERRARRSEAEDATSLRRDLARAPPPPIGRVGGPDGARLGGARRSRRQQ
jgi:hypothetical protein